MIDTTQDHDIHELRIKVAKVLAYETCGGHEPHGWRYDGTHAAGDQMLRTVNIVMKALMSYGWGPADG